MPYEEHFYQSIVDHGAMLIWVAGLDKGCYYFNRTWLTFTGRTLEQEYGDGWAEGVHPDDYERCLSIYTAAFDRREAFSMAYRLKRHDGRYRWLQDDGKPVHDDQGEFTGFIGYCLDIHELKIAEIRLQQHKSLLAMMASGISVDELMEHFTEHLHQLYDRYRFRLFHDAPPPAQTQLRPGQWLVPVIASKGQLLAQLLITGSEAGGIDRSLQDALSHELSLAALILEKARADEALKLHQQALERMAHYDALTNLPNRVLLLELLRKQMAWCQRGNQHLAVAFIDLDGFKQINDHYNHAVGDQVLVCLTHRMKTLLRESDELARLGGDEFVLLLPGLDTPEDYSPVINRVLACLKEPVNLTEGTVQVSASIGITLYPQAKASAEQLIHQADQAMYQAKRKGRNQYQVFVKNENPESR